MLTGSIEEWSRDFSVTVVESSSRIYLDLAPKSGEDHDFTIFIDSETREITGIDVGEVIPEPEDEWTRLSGYDFPALGSRLGRVCVNA